MKYSNEYQSEESYENMNTRTNNMCNNYRINGNNGSNGSNGNNENNGNNGNNGNDGSGGGLLHYSQNFPTPLTVPAFGFIPLSANLIHRTDNNEFTINLPGLNSIKFNRFARYEFIFTIVARIPTNAPTTIPLSILVSESGRPVLTVTASSYNTSNTATLTAIFMAAGNPSPRAGIYQFRNNTRNAANNQSIPIEVLSINILARRLYDIVE